MSKKPPRAAEAILEKLSHYNRNHSITGDLEEEYFRVCNSRGSFAAWMWYWSQAIRSLPKYMALIFAGYLMMVSNYVKVAVRNSGRNRLFTLINVIGLSIGVFCFIMIMLFVQYEFSYDRFYENSDDIYRIAGISYNPEITRAWGWTSVTMARQLAERYPEIVRTTRILTETGEVQVRSDNQGFIEERVMYADSNFFDLFSMSFIAGDASTALHGLEPVVISESTALKYFGASNPIGKTVIIRNRWEDNLPHTVTGVTRDIPANSHFHFDFMLPIMATRVGQSDNTGYWQVFNYIQLQKGYDYKTFEEKLLGFVRDTYGALITEAYNISYDEYLAQGRGLRYELQPLKDIHLKSNLEHEIEKNGSINTVILFFVSAILILLTACFNFVNLSTARSISRAKEVGIRKTLGSFRKQLIAQFLTESVVLSLLSMGIALTAVKILLPGYREFSGRLVDIGFFDNFYVLPVLFGFALALGLVTGSYPALYLSRYKPVSVLKGNPGGTHQKQYVRNFLVLIQCVVSIVLIAGTAVVKDQIDFLLDKNMGYDDDYLLILSNGSAVEPQYEVFREEILRMPDVKSVAASGSFPTRAIHVATFTVNENGEEKSASLFNIGVDAEFIKTLGMEMAEGRNFNSEIISDSNAVILNESAVRALGLEKPFEADFGRRWAGSVVGIVKDFHFRSLHYPIGPLIFLNLRNHVRYISIRINPEGISPTVDKIQAAWNTHTSDAPFNYTFLNGENELLYDAEIKTRQVVSVFAAIAVLIGCLGLFGLTAYTLEQKTREIGIRKAVGASIWKIVLLLSKDFFRIISAAIVIAIPLVLFFVNLWLENFAYRITPNWQSLSGAGIIALLIGILAISYHVLKAAYANPADSLRHE